jgi:DNA-binding response OmpR family regulator
MIPSFDTDGTYSGERAIVLLVDDQAFVAEVIRRFLADEQNLVLHYCSDPNEAVETANRLRPLLILQDLVMPGVDGLAIVSRFRANPATKNTPIVVLSSKEDPETKSLAFSVGANDYLVKLPEQLEFVARVRYHANAYRSQIQRDVAFRALRESQQQLLESNAALMATNQKLGEALGHVKQLRGLLPICCYCKRVRNDGDYWKAIDEYLTENSDLRLSHGVCDECEQAQVDALKQELVGQAAAPGQPSRTGLHIAPE